MVDNGAISLPLFKMVNVISYQVMGAADVDGC